MPQYCDDLYEINRRLRSERMAAARAKGSHTKKDWIEMKEFFNNTCVRCLGEKGYNGVVKDHIIPIYRGGSHGLDNIQPLCAHCNASKGPENADWRPFAAKHFGLRLPKKYKQNG